MEEEEGVAVAVGGGSLRRGQQRSSVEVRSLCRCFVRLDPVAPSIRSSGATLDPVEPPGGAALDLVEPLDDVALDPIWFSERRAQFFSPWILENQDYGKFSQNLLLPESVVEFFSEIVV